MLVWLIVFRQVGSGLDDTVSRVAAGRLRKVRCCMVGQGLAGTLRRGRLRRRMVGFGSVWQVRLVRF